MSRLEQKIPPDVVWVIVAGLMWLASTKAPRVDLPTAFRVGTGAFLTAAGVWLVVGGRMAGGQMLDLRLVVMSTL